MEVGFRYAAIALGFFAAVNVQALDAPAIPGFTTNGAKGVLLPGRAIEYSAPTIADIDGNPDNGKEIAVEGADGVLYVLSAQGALLWSADLPTKNCSAKNNNKAYSSPAVGDLYGTGMPYVIAGYGGLGGRACDGGIAAFRGSDGAQAWNFSLKAFAKKEQFGTITHGVFASPAMADTDGDGKMEVAFGSFDRNVYLLNFDGSVRWYYNAADTIWSSPSFADINGDGILELIIGTDISQNTKLRPVTKNGGFVYAFKTAPKAGKKRYFFRDKNAYYWATYLDQVVYSAPIIADVLPESSGKEVIVASGCFFPQGKNNKKGKWVKVLRLRDGKVLKTLNTTACTSASPAVGDIDDDGVPEIFITVNGSSSVGGDGKSRIMAFKASSSQPIWSAIPPGKNDAFGGHFQSAVVSDIDQNGSLEVLFANNTVVHIMNGATGASLGTLSTGRVLKGTPAIDDINNDGLLDVVIGGGNRGGRAMVYGWTEFNDILGSAAGLQTPGVRPWPMYRGNPQHTANAD